MTDEEIEHVRDLAEAVIVTDPPLTRRWRWFILVNSFIAGIALVLAPLLYSMVQSSREDARNNQASANAFFCGENNRQDRTLGRLVQASVPEKGKPDTFGAGLDPATLSAFDVRVLKSIAKVQTTDPQSAKVTHEFQHELVDLNDPTPCRKLALRVASITGIDPNTVEVVHLGPETTGKPGGS